MIGIQGAVVIVEVAAYAGVRRAVVVAVVAVHTLIRNERVRAVELVKIVVVVEPGRHPAGIRRVALGTVLRKTEIDVVRIVGGVKIVGVAVHTTG